MGLIYIIQGRAGTPVKIGYTSSHALLSGRMAALQVSHPYVLRIILTASGSMQDERKIHRELQADRLLGEWFEWTPRIEAFVATLKEHGEIDAAISAFAGMEAAQTAVDNLLAEAKIAAIFGFPVHRLRAARRAGDGPPFVEKRVGKMVLRMYRIGDFRAWLTANGKIRQSINWTAAGGYRSDTLTTRASTG